MKTEKIPENYSAVGNREITDVLRLVLVP